MGKLECGQRHAHRTIDTRYALETVKHAAILEMRVGDCFGHRPHPRRRHVARLEVGLPLVRGLGPDDIGDDRGLARAIVKASLVIGLDHVGPLDRSPEPRLLTDVAGPDHYHTFLCVIGAVRGEGLLVAVRPWLGAVAEIAGQEGCLHHHRDPKHGEVDMLPLAGTLALKKGARKSKGAHRAGRVINRWGADLDWVHLLSARRGHDPRGGLDYMVIGRFLAPHAVLPECR